MPSDAFIGVLTGLAGAHRERQKNLFDQEAERREQMAKAYEKVAEHPSITPEGQEQYFRRAFEIRTLPAEKKMPKEWESFISEIAPKFGQSWLGGQTSRKVEAQPMPIGADLEGGAARTPEPSTYQAPMPEPPPGTQRSAFFSPQEMSQQKIAEAVQMLQALGPIQREQALETERAKLAMQPEKFSTAPAGSSIVSERSGAIVGQAPKPDTPPNMTNLSRRWVLLGDAKEPVQVLDQLDPADPNTVGRTFLPQANGQMLDVTGQPMRPAGADAGTSDSLLNQLRSLDLQMKQMELETLTKSAPGQLIYAATGRPVPDQRIGDQAALRLGRFETAITQADVVRGLLDKIGSTGAVKGYVLEHGVYWPVAQDNITPDQVAAVTEIQRMVNNYIYAVSGAQINENELVRIAKTAPSLRFTPEANNAVLGNFKRFIQTEQKNYLKQRGWAYQGVQGGGSLIVPGGALEKLIQGQGR